MLELIALLKEGTNSILALLKIYISLLIAVQLTGIHITSEMLLSPEMVKLIFYTILLYMVYYVLVAWCVSSIISTASNKFVKSRIDKDNYKEHSQAIIDRTFRYFKKLGYGKDLTMKVLKQLHQMSRTTFAIGLLFLQAFILYQNFVFIAVFVVSMVISFSFITYLKIGNQIRLFTHMERIENAKNLTPNPE